MAAKVEDYVLDKALAVLDTETTHIELCYGEPANYTEATSTENCGTKNWGAGNAFGAPAAGSPDGRKVTSVAITDGSVTSTQTAGWIAATDRTNSRLHLQTPLAATQAVTNGNTFALAAFTATFRAS